MNIGTLTITLGVDASGLIGANAAMDTFAKNTVSKLNTMSQRARTFGYLASATLTYPVVAAGKASIKMASDFEFSMQKIVGLAGVAQNSVTAWSNEILKMSPELAKRPQELAEALYFISSSGIKGAKAMDVLKISAQAATAGLGDTKEVANLLTSALNAYAGTGLTASKAADILVAAVREGKAEADAFANSIGQIIPIASNLGVSFDQVAGGMAAITLTGASTSNAAVYLKGVFTSLVTASSQGEKALNQMGTSFGELRRVLAEQGLVALMQKLRDLQVKYGDELVGDVLPNIRAMTGFLSIAGKNFKYNTELMERVTNSAGSLGKAFAAVSDTLKVRMDRALAQANSSLIILGKSVAEAFIPILDWLVKKLDQVTQWFDSLSEAQKRHKLVIVAIVAALGPLSLLFSVLGYGVSGLISLVTKLTHVWVLFNTQLTISKGITTIFASKLGWIGLAVTAVVGSIAFFAKKTKEAEEAQNGFNKATVTLNGSLTKLKELTTVDYSNMNFNQLFAVKTEALKAQKEASEGIKTALGLAGMSNEDFLAGKKVPQNQRGVVQAHVDAWNGATKSIKQADTALDAMADQFGQTAIVGEQFTNGINITTDAIKKQTAAINSWYLAQYNKRLKESGEIGTGPRFDKPGVTPTFDEPGTYQKAMMRFNTVGDFTGPTADMNRELELARTMYKVFGDEVNFASQRVQSYTNYLLFLYDNGLRPGNALFDEYTAKIINLRAEMEKFENMSSIFNSIAGAFQNIGNAIGGAKGNWISWVGSVLAAIPQLIKSIQSITLANQAQAISGAVSSANEMPFPYNLIAMAANIAATLIALATTVPGLAEGRIPPGYPNDSFSARLTSGEAVIPLDKMNQIGRAETKIKLEVEKIMLEGSDIAISLRRSKMLN